MSKIPEHKMKKAQALEIPIFNLICRVITSKLKRKPVVDRRSGVLWKVAWGASHVWTLEYSRRAQTSSTGDKLPDFIVKKGDDAVLAIEAKNWALTCKWSMLTVERDIIKRYSWLPFACRRVLIATHLRAKTDNESYIIQKRLRKHRIECFLLGDEVSPDSIWGSKVYKKLWGPVLDSLSFMRKARAPKKSRQKGQMKIRVYTPKRAQRIA